MHLYWLHQEGQTCRSIYCGDKKAAENTFCVACVTGYHCTSVWCPHFLCPHLLCLFKKQKQKQDSNSKNALKKGLPKPVGYVYSS